jgi:recombinase-like zinc beta ribbon protein
MRHLARYSIGVTDRPESEWIRTTVESLRIIDEDLWKRVQSRRDETEKRAVRFESGHLSGRPPKNEVINLLAGIATCGECGGGIIVEQSNNKKGRYKYYICHRRKIHGTCSNTLRIPAPEMNEAVLQAIEEHALTPEAIEQVVLLSESEDAADQRTTLERERAEVEKKIARLTSAIESGGELASLVARIGELETRRGEIDEASAHGSPACPSRAHRLQAACGRSRLRLQCAHALRQAVYGHRHRPTGPPLVHRRHRPVRQGRYRARGYGGTRLRTPARGCAAVSGANGLVRPARLERATSWFVD